MAPVYTNHFPKTIRKPQIASIKTYVDAIKSLLVEGYYRSDPEFVQITSAAYLFRSQNCSAMFPNNNSFAFSITLHETFLLIFVFRSFFTVKLTLFFNKDLTSLFQEVIVATSSVLAPCACVIRHIRLHLCFTRLIQLRSYILQLHPNLQTDVG